MRPGFSLVELVVAIMLLTVGLGALAGTSAWLMRETSSARRQQRAAALARSRLELLRLAPCADQSGTEIRNDLIERWSLVRREGHVAVVVSVTAADSGSMRTQRYHASIPC